MREFLAHFPCSCILTASAIALIALVTADPHWARSAGVDVWNLKSLRNDMHRFTAERDDLHAKDLAILQRMVLKEALILDLIDGHISVSETSQHFLMLIRMDPESLSLIRSKYPGDRDEHKAARNVIDYATHRLDDSNPLHLEVLDRLECELQAALAE